MRINDLVEQAHKNAVEKGFWDNPREIGTMLALIHSEVSEALEADRHGDMESFAEELADICIRVFDVAGGLEINLEEAIISKMLKNRERPRLHGKMY